MPLMVKNGLLSPSAEAANRLPLPTITPSRQLSNKPN